MKENNNLIEIKSKDIAKIHINIEGENNKVIIEDIIVKGYLNINIVGNNSFVCIKDKCSFEGTDISLCEENNHVIIDEDCMFALGTVILASDFHSIIDINTKKRINTKLGVDLGKHIWVASRALILKGSKIETGSVVSAGAVVTGKFPSYCIIGGVPAKILKKDTYWLRDRVDNEDIILPSKLKEADIKFCIEEGLTDDNNNITGWAVLENISNVGTKYIAEVEDFKSKKNYYPVYKYNSKDVADFFKNDNYSKSRFSINLLNMSKSMIKSIKLIILDSHNLGYYIEIFSTNLACSKC